MWREMARIVHEVRPRFVFVENSPMLTSRGLGVVLGDLAAMGFDARWGVLGAADVGANHQRDRIWIVAKQMGNSNHNGQAATKVREVFDEGGNNKQAGPEQASKSQRPSKQYAEMADPLCNRLQRVRADGPATGSIGLRCGERRDQEQDLRGWEWWAVEPDVGRVVDGLASRVDRLKAIGNGQVPLCAATAWTALSGF